MKGAAPRESVVVGLARVSKIILAAGAIMTAVFLGFATDPDVIGEPAGPCAHRNSAGQYDLKCWYHQSNTWKPDCGFSCGNELLRFDPGYAYQEDGTAYAPRCDLSGG